MDKLKITWPNIAHIKKRQWINLSVVVGVVLMIGWGVLSLVTDTQSSGQAQRDQTALINMTDPLTHVNESSIWVERTQNTLANTQKTTDSLQQQLKLLSQAKAEQAQSGSDSKELI